jgi:hypothetical protein
MELEILKYPLYSPYDISTPEIWKSTDVEEARPLIVCVVFNTCFKSKNAVVFAAIATPPSRSISFRRTDAVTPDVVGLQITMFDTTVVVNDGTVYSVVLDVAAAVLASTFVNVGIYCSLS